MLHKSAKIETRLWCNREDTLDVFFRHVDFNSQNYEPAGIEKLFSIRRIEKKRAVQQGWSVGDKA